MRGARRTLAWVLTLTMLIGLLPGLNLPGIIPTARAADDDGEVNKDAFGIEMAPWTEAQEKAAEANAPLGGGMDSATSVMTFAELYISSGYDRKTWRTGLFDWTDKDAAQGVEDIREESLNRVTSNGYKFVDTAAIDMNGSGKDEYVANLAYTSSGNKLQLFITDSKGNIVTNTELVASGPNIDQIDKLSTYQIWGAISVTAGDFDGDGKDSILVYIPALGVNPCIWQYKVENGRLVRGASVTEDLFGTLGLTRPKDNFDVDSPNNQPVVHMVAEDVDRDGYDELILTAGTNDWVQSNSDAASSGGRLGSQLFVYDEINGAFSQTYHVDLHTSGGTADEKGRIVWASSTVGNMEITSSGVDYPEIVAAGYVDDGNGYDIEVPHSDDIGAVVVGVDPKSPISGGTNVQATYYVKSQQTLINSEFSVNGFYEDDGCNNLMAVQAFADRGLNQVESVFISGVVFRYSTTNNRLEQTYLPGHFSKGVDSVQGTEVTNTFIQTVTAGNFNGNREGREQIVCAVSLRQSGHNNSWSDVIIVYNEGNDQFDYTESDLQQVGFPKRDCFYITVNALDVDDDSLVLTLTEMKREYSEPDVMAILEAPPYFAEIDGGDTGNSATTYGTSTSSGGGTSESTGFSAGITVGYEVDGLFFGGGAETSINTSFTSSAASSHSTAWAIDYSNDAGDNLVVVYRCPVACYRYVDQNGEEIAIFRSEEPATSMIPVEEYNALAPQFGLDPISDDLLGEPGNPFSYRSSTGSLNGVIDSVVDAQVSPNGWVQYYGLGTVTQSLETGTETEETFEYGLDVSVSVWGKAGGAKAGVQAGYSESHSETTVNGSSVTKSGTVTGKQVDGYDFQWKFVAFQYDINDNTVPVLGYLVQGVVAPPSPPVDLTVDDVTSSSLTLSWDHGDRTAQQYRIYRVLDESSMPYVQVATVAGNVNEYTITGLNPGTTYTYVVRAVGYDDSGVEQISVDSSPVTARTTTDGTSGVIVTLSTENVSSTGEQASITAHVYNPGGNTQYRWQYRTPGGDRWVDLKNGEGVNEGIGTVSGAAATTLTMRSIDSSLDGASLRCVVIAPTPDATPEYYYSAIATISLKGSETATTLTVTGATDGEGSQETPYTGLSDYTEITQEPSTVNQLAPVTVKYGEITYTIYSYKNDPSSTTETPVYVAVTENGVGGSSYYKAEASGNTYIIGDQLTLGGSGYRNSGGPYTEPTDFDGSTLETATVTTGEGENEVTTTYYRSYLFGAAGKPTTEYWYNEDDGKYYTRTEVAEKPGTYTYTVLADEQQPGDNDDVRRVYYTTDSTIEIVVDQKAGTDIYVGNADTGYGYYKFEAYTGANTEASAIFWYASDTGLYYEETTPGDPPTTTKVKYADSAGLDAVMEMQTVQITANKAASKSGTRITLSSRVTKDEGAVSTTVDYLITHLPTGSKTTLSAASGSNVTWTATAPGLYEITATARSTVSTLSSSSTCYYYAREVAPEGSSVTEYRLLVTSGSSVVSNDTYSSGKNFVLTLESREAAGVSGTPGEWTTVSEGVTYTVTVGSDIDHPVPLTNNSYTPAAAGSYSFAAKVSGNVVATAMLNISKQNVTLSPVWDGLLPETLSDIRIQAQPEIPAAELAGAIRVSCDLYDSSGNMLEGKYGSFPVTLSWTADPNNENELSAEAKTLQSRYNITQSAKTLYRMVDTVTVQFSSGENGTLTAAQTDSGSGGDQSFNTGASIPTTNHVKFTAQPNEGFVVEKWTVNGTELTGGDNIQTYPNGGQTLTLDLIAYTGTVTVNVTFTNSRNRVTFSSSGNGSVTAKDGSGNPVSSGDNVAHNAAITLTAVPNEGYMVASWTVNGKTYTWPTGEYYREDVLVLEQISQDYNVVVNFAPEAATKVIISDAVDVENQVTSAATVDVKYLDGSSPTPEDGSYTVRQDDSLVLTAVIVGGSDNTRVTEWQSSTDGVSWSTISGSGGLESITIHNFTADTLYVRVKVSTAQSYRLSWTAEMADDSALPTGTALTAVSNGVELTSGAYQTAFTAVDFTLTLDDAYYVVGWSSNVVGNGKTAALDSLTGDTAVTVTIAKKPVLTIENETGGIVEVKGTVNGVPNTTVDNGGYVDYNTAITVTLTPRKGYVVGNVSGSSIVGLAYADGSGETTDTMTYTVEHVTVGGTVPQDWRALDQHAITFSVVDTNDDGTGDFGTLAADVERKGMADYATAEDEPASTSGSTTVYEGGTITFTAAADTGYRVKEWKVDDQVYETNGQPYTAATLTLTSDAAKNVTVQFEVGAPQVSFDQPANGSLSATTPADGGKTVPFTSGGATVLPITFTVAPKEHYEVKQWTVNGIVQTNGEGNPITDTTFTLAPSGNALVAVELWGEELNAQVTPGTGGTARIDGTIRYDETVTIVATPDVGYVVESIGVAGEESALYTNAAKANGEQSATYKLLGNTDFTVAFAKKPVVTFSAANGTISASGTVDGTSAADLASGHYVDFGTSVELTAQANTGFIFDGWYVNGVKDESVTSLTYTLADVSENVTVEARFFATPDLAVTYGVSDGTMGTIAATASGSSFTSGDLLSGGSQVVFTVTPAAGHRVASWTGLPADAVISADKTTATVAALDQALTIEAVLEVIPQRTITITEPQHGTITATVDGQPIASGTTVPDGTEVTFTAIADANWMFDKWTGDASSETGSTITLTVTNDVAVGVDFAEATYYIVQYSVTGTGGTASGVSGETDIAAGTVVQVVGGSTVVITATPDSGQMVKSWTVNGETVTKGNLATLGLTMHPLSNTLTLDYLSENAVITVEFETYAGYAIPTGGPGYTVENVTRTPDDTDPAGEIRQGGDLTFTVKPNADYAITAVTVADQNAEVKSNADGTWTVTILNVQEAINLNVTAVAGIPLTIDCGANGTVTVKRDGAELAANTALMEGDQLMISAQANSGYQLASLTVNGTNFSSGSTYTVQGTDTAVAVKATFEALPTGGGGSGSGGGGSGGGVTVSQYAITVESSANGTITADRKDAEEGTTVTLTSQPDQGYVLNTLTVTDKDGNVVKTTDKGDGTYTFVMPASKVTVKASFAEKSDQPVELPFIDVDETDWFFDAVCDVYDRGLMGGTSSTTFAPYLTTTRSMMVTILWRLEGEPQADFTTDFTDVERDIWYTEAVQWADSQGIVKGYSSAVFGPNDTVTREQMAVILYRYVQSKGIDASARGDLSTFIDGGETSSWAVEAMEWAIGSGLLSGKGGGVVDPTGTATRAEVAQIFRNFSEYIAK